MQKTREIPGGNAALLRKSDAAQSMSGNVSTEAQGKDALWLMPFSYSPRHEFSEVRFGNMGDCPSNCIYWSNGSKRSAAPSAEVDGKPPILGDVIKMRMDGAEYGFVYNDANDVVFLAPARTVELLKGLLRTPLQEVRDRYPGVMQALRL